MRYAGACHCGGVRVAFEAPHAPSLRACQCSFCRAHGAKTASDPGGTLTITGNFSIYRFASRTADVLICPICGVYIAASITGDDGRRRATLNVAGTMIPELKDAPAEPISYDAETPEQKRARRQAKWTPTTIEGQRP